MKVLNENLKMKSKPYKDSKLRTLNVKFICNPSKIDCRAGTFLIIPQERLSKIKCNFGFSYVLHCTLEYQKQNSFSQVV